MPTSTEHTPSVGASPREWADWCAQALAELESERAHDPLANSVRALAFVLARAMAQELAQITNVKGIAGALADEALIARAERLAETHLSGRDPAATIRASLDALDADDFHTFKDAVERSACGVVFTAHPTFATPRVMRDALGEFAANPGGDARLSTAEKVAPLRHLPDADVSLYDEHQDTLRAINNAQHAIDFARREIRAFAAERFGDEATAYAPSPISLATWVGYDLDGRTDIHWGQTFRLRLSEKSLQLKVYAGKLKKVTDQAPDIDAGSIIRQLNDAAALAEKQGEAFAGDLNDPATVIRAANLLTGEDPARLVDISPVAEAIDELARNANAAEARTDLLLLAGEMRSLGLGVARIHLRVNAAQVRSTLRADLGVDETTGFSTRSVLEAAARRSAEVSTRQVNMASVFREQMTARRQFMICAQFRKHIDSSTPIRFLIAECEAPATVMGAVFLARLYDVDDIVDISPLFETPQAIESGGRFMERLLDEAEYRAYIAKRGRVSIQLGFSDAGRFMGQIPCALSVERLHILLARALESRGVRGVETVVFNTHGESMGRGAFPPSGEHHLQDRFNHLMTPWTRMQFARRGLALNGESSFQGGDGFLHFQNQTLARSTIASLFVWGLKAPPTEKTDTYYKDINFSWDFYRAVKSWQEALFENEDYGLTLSRFAPNMLVKTGSRRVRRTSDAGDRVEGPRSMRAIPNNAILQQLAVPANVFGGVGTAAGREPDRFQQWLNGSSRARDVVRCAGAARRLTDLGVLRAYASIFDATLWRICASDVCAPGRPEAKIAARLADHEVATALSRLANLLNEDLNGFDAIVPDSSDENEIDKKAQTSLRILHAVRIALVMEGFRITAMTPAFSRRHGVTHEALIDRALRLDFSGLADQLAVIFPYTNEETDALSGISEPADDEQGPAQGYPEVHQQTIDPLREIAQAIGEISVAISHFYSAYG